MAPTDLMSREGASPVEDELFELEVIVVTEEGTDRMPVACGTSDGCQGTCASACASAV